MYRFYFWRNMVGGFFVEGKLTYGYFDLYELYYYALVSASYRGFYSQEKTSAYGFGTSIGLSRKPRGGPVFINLSIGWQFLPLRVTQTKVNEGYGDLPSDVDDVFWYIGGPGSVVEVKFIIGGIF
jgi:hypothetical protein